MVRTAYGDSMLTYNVETIPDKLRHFMMGIFQLNGSETQPWSIVSSILFSSLRTQGCGIHFVNSFTTEISQVVGFSYVDDSAMLQSNNDIEATH